MANPVPRKRAKRLPPGTTYSMNPARPVLPPNDQQHRVARARAKSAKLKWRALTIPSDEELLNDDAPPPPSRLA